MNPGGGNNFASTGPALGNLPAPDAYLRIKQNIEGLQARLIDVLNAGQSKILTPEQLAQVQKALQANGHNPLNVTGLIGKLLTPQDTTVQEVATLPTIGSSTDGQIVVYRHVLWRFSIKTHKWAPISTILLEDIAQNRGNYDPAQYAPGVLFYSTDRDILYVQVDTAAGPLWMTLCSGAIVDTHTQRNLTVVNSCSTNGTDVTGAGFIQQMQGNYIWINPSLYLVKKFISAVHMTLAHDAGNQNSVQYTFELYPPAISLGKSFFYETDRTVFYMNRDATGSASCANRNINWFSGIKFDPYWIGLPIQLESGNFNIVAVLSNTQLQVDADAGNHNHNGYLVDHGSWQYVDGVYRDITTNRPGDLDLTTDIGFLFFDTVKTITQRFIGANSGNLVIPYFAYDSGIQYDVLAAIPEPTASNNTGHLVLEDKGYLYAITDFGHIYHFDGNNWQMAPWDPGSAFIVPSADNNAPKGGNWQLCDGSTTTVMLPTLSINNNGNFISSASVITPNLTGDVFLLGGVPANNNSQRPATPQHWGSGFSPSLTDDTLLPGHNVTFNTPTASNNNTTPITIFSANNNGDHVHQMSDNNAPFQPPSEANGGLPLRVALKWWLRR